MKKLIAFLTTILSVCFVTAQTSSFSVTGKILDAAGKAPLQAASVFAQNTTIGTATDAQGNFTLWLPNGGYDLVITFTGYETVTRRISNSDDQHSNMIIEMKLREKSMEEVAIKTSNEIKNGLEKYGDFFSENFIGKSLNSSRCNIKNKEALKFYFSKKRNRLKVLSPDQPLEIENLALGYRIKYTLDSFTHDYNTQVSTFTGYPLFEEMQPASAEQAAEWKTNRSRAYKGSILQFMRSVYYKRLKEDGFEVQFIVKNNGADTAISGLNYYGALNYSKDDSTGVVEISPNQQDIAIIYKKEEAEKNYLELNDDAPKKFELSVINIPLQQAIGIEQNGFYYDQNDITITGYWSWEKVADMLPYDYKEE